VRYTCVSEAQYLSPSSDLTVCASHAAHVTFHSQGAMRSHVRHIAGKIESRTARDSLHVRIRTTATWRITILLGHPARLALVFGVVGFKRAMRDECISTVRRVAAVEWWLRLMRRVRCFQRLVRRSRREVALGLGIAKQRGYHEVRCVESRRESASSHASYPSVFISFSPRSSSSSSVLS